MSLFDDAAALATGAVNSEPLPAFAPEIPPVQEQPAQKEPVSYAWLEVGAAAGMTDLTTDTLDHALFLFARHLVTSCPDDQFMAMGHRYCPSWRTRLHPEAWTIVEDHIRVRLKQIGWKKKPTTSTEGRS